MKDIFVVYAISYMGRLSHSFFICDRGWVESIMNLYHANTQETRNEKNCNFMFGNFIIGCWMF